ncbi:MAG: hypothetical protein C4519_16800 [Desulfobacteraceae bacterium]|nr:MAG: hypothetical protein C4519_16800 [Desulfobacteraceae bacterium]
MRQNDFLIEKILIVKKELGRWIAAFGQKCADRVGYGLSEHDRRIHVVGANGVDHRLMSFFQGGVDFVLGIALFAQERHHLFVQLGILAYDQGFLIIIPKYGIFLFHGGSP